MNPQNEVRAQRFFLLGCCAPASPPSAPRLAAEPAAKRPRLGVQSEVIGRIGDFGRASRPLHTLPLGIHWALSGTAARPESAAQPGAWRAGPRKPGRRLQHAAAPLHHRGVAEELDPALSPQRPQRAHLVSRAYVQE